MKEILKVRLNLGCGCTDAGRFGWDNGSVCFSSVSGVLICMLRAAGSLRLERCGEDVPRVRISAEFHQAELQLSDGFLQTVQSTVCAVADVFLFPSNALNADQTDLRCLYGPILLQDRQCSVRLTRSLVFRLYRRLERLLNPWLPPQGLFNCSLPC